MKEDISYTTEEIAQILKVSKLTVYDLIKKEQLPSYRVGRQIRIDAHDLADYKEQTKSRRNVNRVDAHFNGNPPDESKSFTTPTRQIIISGQDLSLDILANYIEKNSTGYRPLRSYTGSLNSLVSMYQGEADVVSTHLFDGDTGEYNIPYIRKILVGQPYLIINFLSRWEGFYVRKGNPKNIQSWTDLTKPGITMVNREKGSGVRVLIDEKFRIEGISPQHVLGYEVEVLNHIGVASKVASEKADVGIGTEKTAHLVDVDFIPLIQEQYDLVILKTPQNEGLINLITHILHSDSFQKEIQSIGGYDLSKTGKIIYETF